MNGNLITGVSTDTGVQDDSCCFSLGDKPGEKRFDKFLRTSSVEARRELGSPSRIAHVSTPQTTAEVVCYGFDGGSVAHIDVDHRVAIAESDGPFTVQQPCKIRDADRVNVTSRRTVDATFVVSLQDRGDKLTFMPCVGVYESCTTRLSFAVDGWHGPSGHRFGLMSFGDQKEFELPGDVDRSTASNVEPERVSMVETASWFDADALLPEQLRSQTHGRLVGHCEGEPRDETPVFGSEKAAFAVNQTGKIFGFISGQVAQAQRSIARFGPERSTTNGW